MITESTLVNSTYQLIHLALVCVIDLYGIIAPIRHIVSLSEFVEFNTRVNLQQLFCGLAESVVSTIGFCSAELAITAQVLWA
jgi:hypothetical protein